MSAQIPPILLIAWHRPETTRQVINAIRIVTTNQLFIACDVPNRNRINEAAKVAATRHVLGAEINWPCNI